MLELGIGADVVRGIGWVFWGGIAIGLWLAVSKPKTGAGKAICTALVLAVPVLMFGPSIYRGYEYRKRYAAAKALFDERCKTAGETIYRTVDDVEGVLLLNLRGEDWARHAADRDWPDAGLANEAGGDAYIDNFLAWEHHEDKRNPRGYLNQAPSDLPGYRYVDAKGKDGLVYRYTFNRPGTPGYPSLARTDAKEPLARYAVAYKNLLSPSDREQWVAGTTVTIADTRNFEILAQATWYSFEPGLGSTAGGRQPWRFAQGCPNLRGGKGRAPTRFFVDQVLKPKKGE